MTKREATGSFFNLKDVQGNGPRMDFKTSTSIWPVDELIRKAAAQWRKYTGEDGKTGSRAGAMREEETAYSGTYSLFPAPLAQWILLRYGGGPTRGEKKTVVLDPFCGGPVRGVVTAVMGYSYHGVDVRQEAVDENNVVIEKHDLQAKYYVHDSRALKNFFPSEFFDMMFTCPPYYNLEVYSEQKDDISNTKNYEDFLEDIYQIWEATYSILKKDAFACIVVGNFRQGDELIDFRGDTVALMKEAGFTFWQDVILSRSAGSAAVRAGTSWRGLKLVPRHEHLLVFRK